MIEKIKNKIIFEAVRDQYENKIPFHRLLNLKMSKFDFESAEMILPWNDQLIGNSVLGSLHGGVIATVLDSIGGLVAVGNFLAREKQKPADYLKKRISKMGTIDLRVDYLLPGKGTKFTAIAKVIRGGKRVTVCRMEMHNDDDNCIALGTGTYLWSK